MRWGECSGKLFLWLTQTKAMDFQHKQGQKHSSYYLEQDGEQVAEIVYSTRDDGTLVIEHTEVDDRLQGQHVGQALVERMVQDAQESNQKILPLCSFAAAQFERKPEWASLRA